MISERTPRKSFHIFDYWTDPAGFHVEHYVDGNLVNEDNPTRKYPFGRDTLLQWGPTFPGLSGQPDREGVMQTPGSWRQLFGCSGTGGVLPDFRQSAADCCVSWARADAIPKWRDGPRPADQSCRQQSRTQDHGPARLAMVALSAGERPGAVVPRTRWRAQGAHSASRDCR